MRFNDPLRRRAPPAEERNDAGRKGSGACVTAVSDDVGDVVAALYWFQDVMHGPSPSPLSEYSRVNDFFMPYDIVWDLGLVAVESFARELPAG